MRTLRFLQIHPYWLLKLSMFLALGLLLINMFTGQNDTILYPFVVLSPLSALLMGLTFLFLFLDLIINLTRSRRNSLLSYVGFAILFIGLFISGFAIIGPKINPIYPVDHTEHNNQTYILTGGLGLVGLNTIVNHTLYECDRFSIICKAVGEVDLVTRTYMPPPDGHDTLIELAVTPETGTISILVDHEVAYSYQAKS